MTSTLEIIARLPWRRARAKDRFGRPQIPHEYTVRGKPPETEELYVALFEAIQSDGVFEVYGSRRQRKRYLYPGDGRKYWAMTTDITDCTVLNRMLIEDDIERLRREGPLDGVEYGKPDQAGGIRSGLPKPTEGGEQARAVCRAPDKCRSCPLPPVAHRGDGRPAAALSGHARSRAGEESVSASQ